MLWSPMRGLESGSRLAMMEYSSRRIPCRLNTHGYIASCLLFFFQAEDGIRDLTVTGVQTCALPISMQTGSVKWIGDQKFVATSPSGHALTVDSDRASNKAPGPMELVLLALGACTATDVVSILEKRRQKLESLEVICSGERAATPPTVWTKLEILYRLRGQLDEAAVKHAIQLSEDKYCSVAAMLRKTAAISWRHEILPPAS